MEERCEILMEDVVERRKRYGKMCTDYYHKASCMENKILNLQLDAISNHRFKSKNRLPDINVADMIKDIDEFSAAILARRKKIEELRKRIKDTDDIVQQMKKDTVSQEMANPLTVEANLAKAKEKEVVKMES